MTHVVVVGSLNMDLVVKTNRFPEKGETILGSSFSQIRGGKGANQAVAASRLGASVSMIGAVGKDAFGRELLSSMKEENIDVNSIRETEEHATGIAQIILAERDNSIIVVPGANQLCTPDWVHQHSHIFQQADILLIQLEIPYETVEATIELAAKYRLPVILNPAPAQWLPESLLQKVSILTPNETELRLLSDGPSARSHADDLSGQAPESDMIDSLLQLGVQHVVVTKGRDGVVYGKKQEEQLTFEAFASFDVEVVDTTGAGDAFNAGLAVAISEGKHMTEAIPFASAVAALAVTKYGAQPSMPSRDEVEEFLQQRGS